jgi:hypothetical protein
MTDEPCRQQRRRRRPTIWCPRRNRWYERVPALVSRLLKWLIRIILVGDKLDELL